MPGIYRLNSMCRLRVTVSAVLIVVVSIMMATPSCGEQADSNSPPPGNSFTPPAGDDTDRPPTNDITPDETATIKYEVILDVAYAQIPGVDTSLTSLDIYLPESGQDHPVVIYVHGGAWVTGDKSNISYKPEAFTQKGYMFVSVNYRLSPKVQHPVHVQDLAKAIAWVYKNAANYRGDNSHISLIGHSAGAHLAALVATDDTYLRAEGLNLDILGAVVLLDGAGYDIPRLIELYQLAYFPIYIIPFGEDPAGWEDASPIAHVAEGKGIPPFLIIHAGNREASQLEAERLAEELHEAGIYAGVIYAPDKTHSSLNQELGKIGDEVTKQVFDFLASYSDS